MTLPPALDLPSDGGGPRFDAPWQARIFAAVVSLADAGCFRWEEFQQRLIDEVGRGDGDPRGYYECWLAAAEALLADRGLLSSDRLADRIVALRPAPSATP